MSSHPQVAVARCTDDDMQTCFEIVSESFGHDAPFVDNYFPNHDTPTGRTQGTERLLLWKQHDPAAVFLKAVLSERAGQESNPEEWIIGIAVWTHMTRPPPADLAKAEDVEKLWPDEDDRAFMSDLWKSYVVPRTQAIEKAGPAGLYLLELLAVHPNFQRRGAGRALVQWGTNKADELGLEAIVEATTAGQRVYESCGFLTQIEEMVFDVDHKFKDRKLPTLLFQSRKAMALAT